MNNLLRKSPLCLLIVAAVALFAATPSFGQEFLQTECEASSYTTYTTHEGMLEFIDALQASSTDMKLSSIGQSMEGREQPFAIFSRPMVTQPWEAMVSGKPIVVCHANVHGGEKTLRESCMMLMRELATKGTVANDLLDHLVILVIPSVNPDGFVRSSRGNSWGIDMNRDYMKQEQASLINLAQNIHNTWHPHIILDGHNGGSRPYNLTYQSTSSASPDPAITALCMDSMFPFMNVDMEKSGYRSYYYSGGNAERWNGGGNDPRISRNYAAYTNTIGILFESPGGQRIDIGTKAGKVGYLAILKYAALHPETVMRTVNNARRKTLEMGQNPGGEVMVRERNEVYDYLATYELRDGTVVRDGKLNMKPVVTQSRTRPYAYVLPREATKAVELLRRHNITVEVLQENTSIDVEAYVIKDIAYQREYNHAAAVNVEVDYILEMSQNFPVGSYIVPLTQIQGRVAAHLLEPETADNVVHWNTMDAWLPHPVDPVEAAAAQEQRGQRGQRNRRSTDTMVVNAGGTNIMVTGEGRRGPRQARQGMVTTARGSESLAEFQGRQRGQRNQQGQRGQVTQQGQRGQQRAAGQRAQRGGMTQGRGRSRGPGVPVVPIYKIMKPRPLPTKLLR